MKTASLRTYHGPGRISIARFARGVPAGFRVYSKLAPGYWFNKVGPDEYCRRYIAILEGLDPKRTYYEIGDLVAPHEPIIMCWEVPPFRVPQNWCHRRLASAWLEKKLGILIHEVGAEPDGPPHFGELFEKRRENPEFPDVFQDWLDTL